MLDLYEIDRYFFNRFWKLNEQLDRLESYADAALDVIFIIYNKEKK